MGKSLEEPKLPVKQLMILSICRFAEPVALTSVFPYLPEMIESFDIPRNQVAKWAGLLSATFSLSQCVTAVFWGQASDRFGRKPTILIGLTCTMTTSLLFGFSRSLTWAMIVRSIAGASNGNVGIIRTMVAEMVPYKNLQPRAFSVMPLIWTIGSIFGPALGGALANPAARHPKLFGHDRLLIKFPFALPNMVSSIFFLVGLSTGILFLKETLETRRHKRDYGQDLGKLLVKFFTGKKQQAEWTHEEEQTSSLLKPRTSSIPKTGEDSLSIDGADKNANSTAPPSYREVFSPQSNINLLAYTLLALHSIAYDQLLPVFMHLSPQDHSSSNPDVRLPFKFAGGFGIDSQRIGLLFTLYGVFGMFIQFLVFPPLARYYGVLPSLKAVSILFPLIYIVTPFTVLLPTSLSRQCAIFAVMMCKSWAVIFAFPCTTILLTNSARSLRLLGTLNGVATSLSAIGRAAGPSIGGLAFTWGIARGWVIVAYWVLAGCAVLGAVPVWWLIEMEGFGGHDDDDNADHDEENAQLDGDPDIIRPSTPSDIPPAAPSTVFEEPTSLEEEDNFFFDENTPLIPSRTLSKTISHASQYSQSSQLHSAAGSFKARGRRLSNPIGMTRPLGRGGRTLSNGLGQSRDGMGAGGTTYN